MRHPLALIAVLLVSAFSPLHAQTAPASRPAPARTPAAIAEAGTMALKGHADGVLVLQFSPDSTTLASAGADQSIILWDVRTGEKKRQLEAHSSSILSLDFSRDGRQLVSGDLKGRLVAWDLTAHEVHSLYRQARMAPVVKFLKTPDHFISGSNQQLNVWKVGEPRPVRTFQANDFVLALLVTEAGEVITGDNSGTVIAWDPLTGERKHSKTRAARTPPSPGADTENAITGLALRKDGQILVSDREALWSWDRASGRMTPIGKHLYKVRQTFANDSLCFGVSASPLLWIREMDPAGVSLGLTSTWNVHAAAASPDGACVAFGGGGAWGGEWRWHTTGPGEIRLTQAASLIDAVAAERERKLRRLAAQRNPATQPRIDSTVVLPADTFHPDWE